MTHKDKMNETVIGNLNKVRLTHFTLPMLLLAAIAVFLHVNSAWSADNYIDIQKEAFTFLNLQLSKLPVLMHNITQLGDALIILSLCTIFICYAPGIWESLISASLVSALLCCPLKWYFSIPRPAAVFEKDSFAIIGKALYGTNSLPSGHAITIFASLTVLLLALMPRKIYLKAIWILLIIGTGVIISLSRVGVGAHYLLDVTIGSIIGYISGISGIIINRYCKIWAWIGNRKYYPLFIVLFLACILVVTQKILHDNLPVYYFSLLSLLIATYILSKNYVKN